MSWLEELWLEAEALAPRDWRLAAGGAAGRIVADRQRLTQAVMNLATNAARHAAYGRTIEIGGSLQDGVASLGVRDSGPGNARAERERIFDRFAQGAAARGEADGAGLGLAIGRAIAEADGRSRRVSVGGEMLDLTEFTMLETFLRHPGQVLTRERFCLTSGAMSGRSGSRRCAGSAIASRSERRSVSRS